MGRASTIGVVIRIRQSPVGRNHESEFLHRLKIDASTMCEVEVRHEGGHSSYGAVVNTSRPWAVVRSWRRAKGFSRVCLATKAAMPSNLCARQRSVRRLERGTRRSGCRASPQHSHDRALTLAWRPVQVPIATPCRKPPRQRGQNCIVQYRWSDERRALDMPRSASSCWASKADQTVPSLCSALRSALLARVPSGVAVNGCMPT